MASQAPRRNGLIEYRMEIVGGPFDGTRGMRWYDDGEHPVPEAILVGVCPGDGLCAAREESCRRQGKAHVYFWLTSEQKHPVKVRKYELSDSFLDPEEESPRAQHYIGRAIYVIGGLALPQARNESELVGVGAGDEGSLETAKPSPTYASHPREHTCTRSE